MERAAIRTHPFSRKIGMFARPDIPGRGEISGRPGPPGIWGVVDRKAAVKPRVAAVAVPRRLRNLLPPEVAAERSAVSDCRSQATFTVGEHGSAFVDG